MQLLLDLVGKLPQDWVGRNEQERCIVLQDGEAAAAQTQLLVCAGTSLERGGGQLASGPPAFPAKVSSKGARELHVEVKGSSGSLRTVQLTRNEVTHARTSQSEAALAVVESIKVEQTAATGGRLWLFDPWQLKEQALEPLTYSYRLPQTLSLCATGSRPS